MQTRILVVWFSCSTYNTEEFKIVHSIKYPAPVLSIGLSSDDNTLIAGMSNGTCNGSKQGLCQSDLQILQPVSQETV
jgi:hypothetical protein